MSASYHPPFPESHCPFHHPPEISHSPCRDHPSSRFKNFNSNNSFTNVAPNIFFSFYSRHSNHSSKIGTPSRARSNENSPLSSRITDLALCGSILHDARFASGSRSRANALTTATFGPLPVSEYDRRRRCELQPREFFQRSLIKSRGERSPTTSLHPFCFPFEPRPHLERTWRALRPFALSLPLIERPVNTSRQDRAAILDYRGNICKLEEKQ